MFIIAAIKLAVYRMGQQDQWHMPIYFPSNASCSLVSATDLMFIISSGERYNNVEWIGYG